MAVAVIFTIASRASMIFGSGTVSTRTSSVPCQQSAFIKPPCLRLIVPPNNRAHLLAIPMRLVSGPGTFRKGTVCTLEDSRAN
jgi:hypothetical protein